MIYRSLSTDSNLVVSSIAFGCEPLGGADWGNVDIHAVSGAAREALDLGVTLFDTAAVYGLGASETNLRRALGPRIRDVVVSTKAGMRWSPHASGERAHVMSDASPRSIVDSVEASLGRLGIEKIPLLFIHWPDPATPLEDTLGTLAHLQEQGKVGEVGLSNYGPNEIEKARKLMPISAVQVQYSLISRDIEAALVPACRLLGIPLIVWGAMSQGLLTGKYSAETVFQANDRRHGAASEKRLRAAAMSRRLAALAVDRGSSAAQLAIGWVLSRPQVASAIVGIKNSRQLQECVAAASLRLRAEDFNVLEEV